MYVGPSVELCKQVGFKKNILFIYFIQLKLTLTDYLSWHIITLNNGRCWQIEDFLHIHYYTKSRVFSPLFSCVSPVFHLPCFPVFVSLLSVITCVSLRMSILSAPLLVHSTLPPDCTGLLACVVCTFRPFFVGLFLAQAFNSNFFVSSWHFTNWISPLLQVQTSQRLPACFSHLYCLSFFTMTYSATVVFPINPIQPDHLSLLLLGPNSYWLQHSDESKSNLHPYSQ